MEVNPGLYAPGQTAPGARLFPAFALVRPTFSVGEVAGTTRCRPACACGRPTASTSSRPTPRPRQRPRLRPQHRRRAAAGAAGHDRRRRVDRSGARRSRGATRSSTCATASSSASAPSCRRRRSMGAVVEPRRSAAGSSTASSRRRPGFPLDGHRLGSSTSAILTNRPDQTCDPNDDAPHTVGAVVQHVVLRAPAAGRRPASARATPGATRSAAPASPRPTCRSSRTSSRPRSHRLQLRVEAFNLFNQTRFDNPGGAIGTANFGRITAAEDGRIIQLGVKYMF